MKIIKRISREDIRQRLSKRKERREQIFKRRRESPLGRKLAPVYLWMNRLSLPLHFFLACLLNLIIEAISRHSLVQAGKYLVASPMTFMFNAYMIFVTLLLAFLVRRRIFFRIVISVFWLVIGCVNGYMLSVRVTPFNAQDLKVIDDALTMLDKYFTGLQGVLLILLILAVIVWLVAMWIRGGQYNGKMYRIPTLIIVIAAFATMGKVTDLAIDGRVVSNYFGNIAFAYEDYGLPYCFSASLFNTGIAKPNNYNKETIDQITDNGKILEVTTGREQMPNIIMLQLESFFDVSDVEFFTTTKDPIPTFHSLMSGYSSGYLKVPSVGAGTANTEFEVLTGMSMRYFGPGEYPYKTIAKYQPMESAATALKEFGYGAHALHNNGGNFYSRADVFNMMGFDTYTSKEFMNILQLTENGWAKDNILTGHIMDALDSTSRQDFVFGITVEGHGDYPEEKVIENPEIEVLGIEDEGKKNAWEYYVNHLYETDKFIADLIAGLEQRGEPVVLVLYGDHLPTMGLEASDLKSRYLFNTNYVIWDNIGLQKEDRNLASYQLMSDVMGKLDLHAGSLFNYHQIRHQTRHYLSDLEMLQYDMLYGECYLYGGKENAPKVSGNFRMGVKDVTLTGLEVSPLDTLIIYGTNMTANSRVYINGDRKSTTFINDTQVEIKNPELEEGDTIVVSQVGSSNRVFHSSMEYAFTSGMLVPKDQYVPPQTGMTDGN